MHMELQNEDQSYHFYKNKTLQLDVFTTPFSDFYLLT